MARPKKLTIDDVLRIRKNDEKWTDKQWSEHFNVSTVTISHAKNGKLAYAVATQG